MINNEIIGIAGGIGSGKSVVSQILMRMGFPTYDCDKRAKSIMDSSHCIKSIIKKDIAPEAITPDNQIDRRKLAEIVFQNRNKLKILNNAVHAAVRDDLKRWTCANWKAGKQIVFVESAIMSESDLDKMVNRIWKVTAPEDLRVERVMRRNACTRAEVIARINTQKQEEDLSHHHLVEIINDGCHSLLLQINSQLINAQR